MILLEECMEAVEKINEEMVEQTDDDGEECYWLALIFAAHDKFLIKFSDDILWDSLNDSREYIDDGKWEEYETIETFLRREIMKFVNKIGRIKL
jgi:saccharopine dehydrogenase-like NADP-dependent oxidoreductase